MKGQGKLVGKNTYRRTQKQQKHNADRSGNSEVDLFFLAARGCFLVVYGFVFESQILVIGKKLYSTFSKFKFAVCFFRDVYQHRS